MKKTHARAGIAVRAGMLLSACAGMLCLVSALPLGNSSRFPLGELSPGETAPFAASFTWSFAQPFNHMRVLGSPAEAELKAMSNKAIQVRLHTEGGQLTAELDHAANRPSMQSRSQLPGGAVSIGNARQDKSPIYRAELLRSFERRQPTGKRHTIRHVLLSCELPAEADHTPTVFLLQLEVDTTLGSVDTMPCSTPARYAAMLLPSRDYQSAAPTGMPEKYNGSPLRRDMLRLLYAMAAIDSPQLAEAAARELAPYAWKLAARAPEPHTPWPGCWGDTAEDAREIARRLTPTLVHLQENDCFDSQALADFINSPLFARIFGESFAENTYMPGEKVQEEPIEYIALPPTP